MSDIPVPWRQYICRACGLIYDESEGDPDSGLAAGTRFEDIPQDWECPLCGVTKSDFELFEKQEINAAPQTVDFSTTPGVVVVGAGLAGWAAIEAFRKQDSETAITLVSACSADRYHKPELSVALSRGMNAEKLIQETAEKAARRLRVKLLSYSYAVGITAAAHQLRTTRGTLNYTHLILAQGARPFLPSQLSGELCWRVNELATWSGLEQVLSTGPQRVAVVGAGMIGCELAEDLNRAGHIVTLINKDAFPLAGLLPEQAGLRLRDSMHTLGIHHRENSAVVKLTQNACAVKELELDDGSRLDFDQVVVATGLMTDTRLAEQAGLTFDKGIVVNPTTLQTSDPNIYALGDCISLNGTSCRFIEPIPNQARAIAQSIKGIDSQGYQHQLPVIRLKTRALPITLHGLPKTGGLWTTVSHTHEELVMEQHLAGEKVVSLRMSLPRTAKTG